MIRSIAAVLAGFLVTFVLGFLAAAILGLPMDGPPTREYLALDLLGRAIAGAAGGATAVRIAAHTPHGHTMALAIAILLLSLPQLLSVPGLGQPSWYPLVISVLGPVSVLIGGLLAGRKWIARDIVR
jgi:hypothetical protein